MAIFFVYRENTFASATIEPAAGQKVISTGPYSIVRHLMYSGSFTYLPGMPVVLGSWRGLLVVILLTPALIWRVLDEEKFLVENLSGYSEYRDKVKYRLAPFFWQLNPRKLRRAGLRILLL
jgi:protein-S-isoprenylcysteine O-methyltransferase Ste14